MIGKFLLIAVLASLCGPAAVFAAGDESNVTVTIRGKLFEDKFGYFVQANGATYDLNFADASKADMHKFYGDIKGELVQVSGALYVEEVPNAKSRLTVYTHDVERLKAPTPTVVTERREVITEPAPIIVREGYVERRRSGIDLPGVHIHW